MTMSSGDTQREAAALSESLVNQGAQPVQGDGVPIHVLQAMREELKAVKEQNETFKNHLNMMEWNSRVNQPAPPPVDPFQGLDPEEEMKTKDAMRMFSDLSNRFESKLAEVKLAAKDSDYDVVIKKYLPLAAQEDPELLEDIRRSPNPYKAAYQAAKASSAYREDGYSKRQAAAPQAHPNAERVVNNLKQSGNLAAVGTSTSTGQFPTFKNMSDEEFIAFKNSRSLRPARTT